ncbi:MAG TPA: hypothetical protein VF828_00695 [Patescibacteria group bacterium]
MESNRSNLDDSQQNSSYLILSLVLILLSVLGVVLFLTIHKSPPKPSVSVITPPQPSVTPLPSLSELNTPSPATSSSVKPVLSPTKIPQLSLTPSPAFINFSSASDKFSVTYSSSRKLYQDKEGTGNRFTFYKADGNIAVHVGPSWSWSHPARTFTTSFLVAGQPTFRYESPSIPAQTLVDISKDGLDYTIQCIHNGQADLKSECEDFMKSFKFGN